MTKTRRHVVRRWALWLLVTTVGMAAGAGSARALSLAGIGTSLIQWMSRTDIVAHHMHITVDTDAQKAVFVDDVTVRSRGGKSVFALLGDDFQLQSIVDPATEQTVPFETYIDWGSLPFTIYRVHLPRTLPSGEEKVLRFQWVVEGDAAQYVDPFPMAGYFYVGHTSLWHPYTPDEGFFTASVRVTARDGQTIIADGDIAIPFDALQESADFTGDGFSVSAQFETPQPVKGIGVAVGTFDELDPVETGGVHLQPYVYREALNSERRAFQRAVEAAAAAYDFMTAHVGPLPGGPNLPSQVDITGASPPVKHMVLFPFWFAAAYPTVDGLVYGGDLRDVGVVDDEQLQHTIAHEMVHAWFGSAVGTEVVGSAWLSEGVSEYLSFLAIAPLMTPEQHDALYCRRIGQPLQATMAAGGGKPLGKIEFLDDQWMELREKSAWMWEAVHAFLGDRAFFALLQAFYADHAGRTVSGADFTRYASRFLREGRASSHDSPVPDGSADTPFPAFFVQRYTHDTPMGSHRDLEKLMQRHLASNVEAPACPPGVN